MTFSLELEPQRLLHMRRTPRLHLATVRTFTFRKCAVSKGSERLAKEIGKQEMSEMRSIYAGSTCGESSCIRKYLWRRKVNTCSAGVEGHTDRLRECRRSSTGALLDDSMSSLEKPWYCFLLDA